MNAAYAKGAKYEPVYRVLRFYGLDGIDHDHDQGHNCQCHHTSITSEAAFFIRFAAESYT